MKAMKRLLATMMALALVVTPMQVRAAELAQPVESVQFVELQKDCYYEEVEQNGVFQLYEGETLISSMQVEKSLFKPNSTLTEGWAQYTDETGKNIEGSFKEATLDTKGYLRCQFTPKGGSTVYSACVKVQLVENWATAQKKATTVATRKTTVAVATTSSGSSEPKSKPKPNKPEEPPIYDGWTDEEEPEEPEETFPGWTD